MPCGGENIWPRFNIWPPFNLSGQQLWPMAENWAIRQPKSTLRNARIPWILLFWCFFFFFNKFQCRMGQDIGHSTVAPIRAKPSGGRTPLPRARAGFLCYFSPGDICMPHLRTSSSSFIYFIAASFALWTQWPVDIILIIAPPPSLAPSGPLFALFITRIPLIFMDFS